MASSGWIRKFRDLFLLAVVVPLVFFALVEVGVRLSGVNTEVIKNDRFKVAIPLWVANETNFFSAEALYRDIVDNVLPAGAADWMHSFEEARWVRYRMKPNVDQKVTNTVNRRELAKGLKVRFQSNPLGFRSHDISRKKPAGTYRIVFLGDSTTFGWGVEQEERFSDVLAERLNARRDGRRYEVINLGIPGYTSWHGRQAFDHFGLPWSPDMVIMSFGANDGKMISSRAKALLQRGSSLEGLKFFLWRFRTDKLLRRWFLSMANPFDKMEKLPAEKPQRVPFVTLGEFRGNLKAIVESARERNCRPVFLGLCCPMVYLAPMTAMGRRIGVETMDGMHILLRSIPEIKSGKRYPHLYQYYRDLYGADVLDSRRILTVTSDSCHPNRLGHSVLADALEKRLF